MSGKVFSIVIIVIAVVMGVLACVVPVSHVMNILLIAKFFDVMLPILGVGALIKYLSCCGNKNDNS